MADDSYKEEFLKSHNEYRRKHQAPNLTLSETLCASAQQWAKHMLDTKCLEHSDTNNGENVFYSYSSAPKELTGQMSKTSCICNAFSCLYAKICNVSKLCLKQAQEICQWGKEAVDSWYSEVKDYDFITKKSESPNTGHFTQVVWKSTKEVGVGMATDGHTVFVVGQYSPPGNITNDGYYEENVLPASE